MFYEASHNEYSIGKFIEHYQNAMPQLVMIRRGYMGDTRSNTLDTQQVKYTFLQMSTFYLMLVMQCIRYSIAWFGKQPILSGMYKGGGGVRSRDHTPLITIKNYSSQLLFQTLTIKVEILLLVHSEHPRLRIHTLSKKLWVRACLLLLLIIQGILRRHQNIMQGFKQ